MMHRTGKSLKLLCLPNLCQQEHLRWTDLISALPAGLYDFLEDKENQLYVLNMPLGQKQASMILIMPYHLEPLDRLEKLLTRKQVDTWLSKMENIAVAISLPKISVEVSHNLQVNNSVKQLHRRVYKSVFVVLMDSSFVFLCVSRNTWLSLAWQRLWTSPRLTCPTSLGRRTCTCPTSSMRQPWSWASRETRMTPASLAQRSWGTPNFSTWITPSFSWWKTTRPTPSCTSAGWLDQRETRCAMSYNVKERSWVDFKLVKPWQENVCVYVCVYVFIGVTVTSRAHSKDNQWTEYLSAYTEVRRWFVDI